MNICYIQLFNLIQQYFCSNLLFETRHLSSFFFILIKCFLFLKSDVLEALSSKLWNCYWIRKANLIDELIDFMNLQPVLKIFYKKSFFYTNQSL